MVSLRAPITDVSSRKAYVSAFVSFSNHVPAAWKNYAQDVHQIQLIGLDRDDTRGPI